MNKHTCTAHMEYTVIVEAESPEAAEILIFETIGEAVTKGRIPLDLFPTPSGAMVIPMLTSVDVKPL